MKIRTVLLKVAVFSAWMMLGAAEMTAANVPGLKGGVATPKPATPKNLEASVYGHKVTLSWANPDMGAVLVQNDFEDETVEQGDDISLKVNGWTVKTTNTSDYSCTWFNYPTLDFMGANDYEMLIYKGQRSAVIYMDMIDDGEHDMHQDEWLISPVMNKVAYLTFSSFIDPRILEAGKDPFFPDHYAVVVSTDSGKTWSEPIWDARYDATPDGGWQTVTLSLSAAPTDKMQVAFRAYGEYSIDAETGDTINQGLHGVWAIDNVTIAAAATVTSSETLLSSNFEGGAATETAISDGGWTIKRTHSSDETDDNDYIYSWFKNSSSKNDPNYEQFSTMVLEGKKSAMLMPGNEYQDEWLISPVLNKAERLSFKYLSTITDWTNEENAGHYVVMVSRDGGTTWGEPIWNSRNDKGGRLKDDMFYVNTVNLSLVGEEETPTEQMRVAFRAYGDVLTPAAGTDPTANDSLPLSGTWVIDQITFKSTSHEQTTPIAYYVVQLDGKKLDSVQDLTYVDKSKKEPGEHTYSVLAVGVNDSVSLPAETTVNLNAFTFPAPQNFVCAPVLDEETGRYTVNITWDAPQTEFKPAYYTLYSDKAVAGTELTAEEGQEGIGISGCYGIYEFSIEAVYKTPDTVSERVIKRLALGVRFGVTDLRAESESADVILSWKAPQEDGHTLQSYTVYRSGEKVAENLTATTCRDLNVKDGLYQYTVIAIYTDKVESVRTSIMHQKGENVRMALPYEQHFNTTFLPEGWRIENQSQRTPDKYTWYFDDGSRLGVKGGGFEGGYAAIDCRDIGMYRLDAALLLPPFDLSTAVKKADVKLSFDYSYAIGGIFRAGVEWSMDGVEWYLLEAIDKSNGYLPIDDGDFHVQRAEMRIGDVILDEDLDTATTLYLRFRYEAARSYHWAIDNVMVGEKTAVERADLNAEKQVVAWASHGVLSVRAEEAIEKVEIYGVGGEKLAEMDGANGETSLSWAVPTNLRTRKPVLVRVSTANAVEVVKVLL